MSRWRRRSTWHRRPPNTKRSFDSNRRQTRTAPVGIWRRRRDPPTSCSSCVVSLPNPTLLQFSNLFSNSSSYVPRCVFFLSSAYRIFFWFSCWKWRFFSFVSSRFILALDCGEVATTIIYLAKRKCHSAVGRVCWRRSNEYSANNTASQKGKENWITRRTEWTVCNLVEYCHRPSSESSVDLSPVEDGPALKNLSTISVIPWDISAARRVSTSGWVEFPTPSHELIMNNHDRVRVENLMSSFVLC